jgi:hypothetical protein
VTIPASYLGSVVGNWLTISPSAIPEFPYVFGAPTNLGWVFGDNAYNLARPFLFGALLLSFIVLCFEIYRTEKVGGTRFLGYCLYAFLLSFAFFPRGIYKYYLATVTPFGAILVKSKKVAILFLGLNILFIVIPRILTPWFLVIIMVSPFIMTCIKKHTSGRTPSSTSTSLKAVDNGSNGTKRLNRNVYGNLQTVFWKKG